MNNRPDVEFQYRDGSIPFKLFKVGEDLSRWEGKSGVFVFAALKKQDRRPFLQILYIGCTLNFSNVEFYLSKSINEHKPSHICFHPCSSKQNPRLIADTLAEYYKPVIDNLSMNPTQALQEPG